MQGTQIRDAIHGMIEVSAAELALIKDEAFQRLRHIRQLGMTYKVYPGASHSRFEHSLGVMHVAGRMMDALYRRPTVNERFDEGRWRTLRQIVRLAALLHDVGHPPFSHTAEECFAEGLRHERYSFRVIEHCFGDLISRHFDDITVGEVVQLLGRGYLAHDLVFLSQIVDGEMDADKLDYLLRDSYYCGVRYGHYDLERILDTLTVVPAKEEGSDLRPAPTGEVWLLGVDSDGVQAVEELIFARYWMFIQVYFHKTRRIYDHYLSQFLRSYLSDGVLPALLRLEEYLALDDNLILQAIKETRECNEWARRIYERDHLSEAFVTSPHHLGLSSYLVVSKLKQEFEDRYGKDGYVDDKARKLPANPMFGLEKREEEDAQETRYATITVQDKHDPNCCESIFDLSLPLRLLSQANLNIVRFYVPRQLKEEASRWCRKRWEQIQTKVKTIEKRWI
ncbi:MAG TPA: HD domain-containing protein, partial [Firmicutes bacterium]|nr:HD domain-containing protein [Bacillota bacterium]